jgi:hypothetical protein
LPGYQSNGLTLYELAQAHKIKRWWLEIPNFLTTLIARFFGTIGKIADWLIPEKWIDETLTFCESPSGKMARRWDQLKHLARFKKESRLATSLLSRVQSFSEESPAKNLSNC